MKAELVLDALIDLPQTIKRLHDPDIITAEVGGYRPARVNLLMIGDPTEVIRDIGTGLIDVDEDWDPAWTQKTMTDINGVEVYWLEQKKAPDAATSEGPRENDGIVITSDDEEEVKEDSNESEN